MNELQSRINLKQKLDEIDFETIEKAIPSYVETKITEKHGMWQKGWAIIEEYPEAKEYEDENKGGRPKTNQSLTGFSWAMVAKETGRRNISLQSWVRLAKEIGESDEDFLKWADEERIRIIDRLRKKGQIGFKETPLLPDGKYKIIYADPPWQYGDKLIDGYGAAEHHYPPMSIEELCALPIKERISNNSVLFLWVTSPILKECFDVIEAWGFEYKTSFIWDKVKHNFGHYNSVRHEFLLVCTKGSCLPENKKLFDSVISIERTEKHSQKPKEFRDMINQLYPTGKRLELFAREKPKGWDVYGNEC